jgi:hypothetical protein
MAHLIHLPKYWMKWRDRPTWALRTALCWVITQRVVVLPYRRFGTNFRHHLQFFLLLNPLDGKRCTETSVRNWHYSLRHKPEERGSHLLYAGSLKSPTWTLLVTCLSANLSTEGCEVFWDVTPCPPIITDVSKDGIKHFATINTAYRPERLERSATALRATQISQL